MKDKTSYTIRKLLLKLFPAAALAGGIQGINALFTDIIVGRFLGENGLAIIGLFGPMIICIGAITISLITGTNILCGKFLGKGDTEGISKLYSSTLFICVAFGAVITTLLYLFPNAIAGFLRSPADMLPDVAAYIKGYGFGIIFIMLFTALMVFLQFSGRDKSAVVLGFVMIALNLVGNILNFTLFNGGIQGVGIVNSLSYFCMTLLAFVLIITKCKMFRFSIKNICFNIMKQSVVLGFPAAIEPFLQFIRNLFINAFALSICGVKGVSALAIASSVSSAICFVITKGHIGATSMVASILASERDVKSLRELPRNASAYIAPIYSIAYLFIFIFSKQIALIFGASAENLHLCVTAIRLITAYSFTNIFKETNVSIFHTIGKGGLPILAAFFDTTVIPLVCCLLAKYVGFWLIPFSNPLGEMACIATYFVYFCIKNKRLPKSIFRIADVPNTLSVPKEDRFELTVKTKEEAITASQAVVNFCKDKGISNRTAYHCGLCIEEIAVFTIENNFKKNNEIDLRLIYENDGLFIMFRDNCQKFDPVSWINLCSTDDKLKSIGIKMISSLSNEMNYISTLGLNVLTITFKKGSLDLPCVLKDSFKKL